jgi:hypothetical protein
MLATSVGPHSSLQLDGLVRIRFSTICLLGASVGAKERNICSKHCLDSDYLSSKKKGGYCEVLAAEQCTVCGQYREFCGR